MKILWLNKAQQDLLDAFDYILADDSSAAVRIRNKIQEAVTMLAKQPHMGRQGRVFGTRELVITGTPYIVVYRAKDRVVQILRVLHGRQQWPNRIMRHE